MPRAKSDSYNTLRLELGQWERERVEGIAAIASLYALLPAAGIALGGAGVAFAGYGIYQWLSESPFDDIWEPIKEYFTWEINLPQPPSPGQWNDPEHPEYERQSGGGQGGAFSGPRPGNPNFWELDENGNWVRKE